MTCCTSERPHDVDPDDGGHHWIAPPVVPDHPAKFSSPIIDAMRQLLSPELAATGRLKVLDPFAGVGGVHQLADAGGIETYGVELQPEWARAHPDTICGSVLELPSLFPAGTFTVLATSPTYGNRMADHHDAADPCKAEGCVRGEVRREGSVIPGELFTMVPCPACKGSGLSKRNTYAHALRRSGAEPVASPENSAVMQWGPTYRDFHERAWKACDQVLAPGALVLLNLKNHVRGGRIQNVVEFHVNVWFRLRCTLEDVRRIPTKGLAHGANHDLRTDAELVVALRKPR